MDPVRQYHLPSHYDSRIRIQRNFRPTKLNFVHPKHDVLLCIATNFLQDPHDTGLLVDSVVTSASLWSDSTTWSR